MLYDIAVGAVSKGVNQPTFVALNVVVCALWILLAVLLFNAATTDGMQRVAPHFAVMLGLCTVLAVLLNWYIANAGIVGVAEQEKELAGGAAAPAHPVDTAGLDEETARKLKELPLTSKIDVGVPGAGGFDTSGLAIQNLPGTTLYGVEKNKAC